MKDRDNEPVTKADFAELRRGLQDDLKGLRQEVQGDLRDLRQELHADLNELRDDIDQKIESAKDEIMRHVGVLDENMRRDVFGARAEEIADLEESRVDHERRIRRLEKSTGLIAA